MKSVVKTFEVGADKRASPQTSAEQPQLLWPVSVWGRRRADPGPTLRRLRPVLRRLPSWLWNEENEASIKKRLKKALEQHKDDVADDDTDAARLAAIRDSEDRAKQKFADIEKKIEELKALLEE